MNKLNEKRSSKRLERARIEANLIRLEHLLIVKMLAAGLQIVEGTVMSPGPAPYRRLDCCGRALAYLKVRPTKRVLRIDVSGLWVRPGWTSRLQIPTASGATTLMVRNDEDLAEAARYLEDVVRRAQGTAMAA